VTLTAEPNTFCLHATYLGGLGGASGMSVSIEADEKVLAGECFVERG
jgi:hypothetical protein